MPDSRGLRSPRPLEYDPRDMWGKSATAALRVGVQRGRTSRRAAVSPSTVRAVVARLRAAYGVPRHGNPRRPLDDLFFILLSNKTSPQSARRVYKALRRAYPSWKRITSRELRRLRILLEPAGLSKIRAAQVVGIIEGLREQFGGVTLAPLRYVSAAEAEASLTTLPGVSEKVAKCVMMYTLGSPVLPVDTHVHRIATRLGWTSRKRADQCHDELESIVPPSLRYSFHVTCVAHGRAVCRPTDPNCPSCVVRRFCAYYRAQAKP